MSIPTQHWKQQVEENKQVSHTVTVVLRKSFQKELHDFHCINCGKIVFQYYKEICLLFDGEVQESEKEARSLCKTCGFFYIIENARV